MHEAAVGLIGILSLMAKMVLMSVTVHEYIIFYGKNNYFALRRGGGSKIQDKMLTQELMCRLQNTQYSLLCLSATVGSDPL